MSIIFLDTSYLIALINRKDELHKVAVDAAKQCSAVKRLKGINKEPVAIPSKTRLLRLRLAMTTFNVYF